MLALKFDRISAVSNLVLAISDMTLEGGSITDRPVQLKIEIINDQHGYDGGHRYFAPRWTTEAAPGDVVSWGDEAVRFKRFYLPHGTELTMAVRFSIVQKRTFLSVGKATVHMHECDWSRQEGSIATGLLSVPLDQGRARTLGVTRAFTRVTRLPSGSGVSQQSPAGTLRVKMVIENMSPDVCPTPEDQWEMLLRNSTISRMTDGREGGRQTPRSPSARSRSPASSTSVAGQRSLEARIHSLEQLISSLNQSLNQYTASLQQNGTAANVATVASEESLSTDVAGSNNFHLVLV